LQLAPLKTVRGRLILAAVAIEFVMLALLVGNSLRLLRDAMGEQARAQAQQIAPVLSAALVAPLAQYDHATVQAVLRESQAIKGIDYLAVTDAAGRVVAASGWPAGKPLPDTGRGFTLDASPPRYDVAHPIALAGQPLGRLQFGLDLGQIVQARQALFSQGLLIAGGELLLSGALLSVLGLLITRQLSALTEASLQVARGRLTPAPVAEGDDDVGRLGAAFNTMSRAIGERVEALQRAGEAQARIAASLAERNAELQRTHIALSAENGMRVAAQAELEQALLRLQDRTHQLDEVLELSPDGFVAFDAQGRVRYANQGFQRVTGLGADAVQGLDEAAFGEALAGHCAPQASFPGLAALRQCAEAADERRRRVRIELTRPAQRVVETGVRLSRSATVSQILYVRDVTHESEVDRMKSEFLSHAAHELRTPMASIFGFSELLLKRRSSPERQQEVLAIIHRQSQAMIDIINELLDLVRIDDRRGKDFQLERCDLAALATAVAADFGVPEGREPPQLALGDAPAEVRGDRAKLAQALRNILSNAYKYSPGGGGVRLALVHGTADDGAPRLGLQVVDQGLGMTPEQVARVFERFYRADSSGNIPGTGLGMAIVKEIVELHGGHAELHSSPGEGTTVTLWLPVAAAAAPAPAPAPHPAPAPAPAAGQLVDA